jgi:hypothetical protein
LTKTTIRFLLYIFLTSHCPAIVEIYWLTKRNICAKNLQNSLPIRVTADQKAVKFLEMT